MILQILTKNTAVNLDKSIHTYDLMSADHLAYLGHLDDLSLGCTTLTGKPASNQQY